MEKTVYVTVLMLSTLAGPESTYLAGSVVTFEASKAQELIDGGFARAVVPQPGPVEAAVTPPVETAVSKQQWQTPKLEVKGKVAPSPRGRPKKGS